ncbi:MAG: DeoR family transcriptional regulator [Candidatus Paceibacterota bacterium]|jgi:hypothetical protein
MEDSNNQQQLEVLERLSKGNKFVFYIYRKISKISCAVYLVTDLIKDVEPLKWQLRKVAAEMMTLRNFFGEKAVFNTVEEYLLELEGSLELGKISKVISEMNALIIQSEVRKLLSEMSERSKEGFYVPELASSFFEVEKPKALSFEELFAKEPENKHEESKGHKGQGVRYDFYNHKNAPKQLPKKGPVSTDQSESKGHRKDEIMRIVKAKGSVTIKDITELVKNCSEKTVQRELLGLVEEGLLNKTGERRWSRYTSAS